jgi:hypothetical protein
MEGLPDRYSGNVRLQKACLLRDGIVTVAVPTDPKRKN